MTTATRDTMREEQLEVSGPLKLTVRSWRPQATARAVLAIVPGFNAHSGYYGWVGEQLAAKGIAVYAVDLRGRGKSDGERFYVDRFEDYVANVTLPVLILHGTEDRATKPSGSQQFFDAAGSRDKTFKLYDGYFHDPLNDVGKEQVLGDITAWLDARIRPA